MRDRKEPVGASSFAKTDMNLFTQEGILFRTQFPSLFLKNEQLKPTNSNMRFSKEPGGPPCGPGLTDPTSVLLGLNNQSNYNSALVPGARQRGYQMV